MTVHGCTQADSPSVPQQMPKVFIFQLGRQKSESRQCLRLHAYGKISDTFVGTPLALFYSMQFKFKQHFDLESQLLSAMMIYQDVQV